MRGAERHNYKRQVTPSWANRKEVNRLYRLSKSLGVNWQVDHIVPLIHPRVCGLHVENNLSVIKTIENRHKSNYFWPDMWNEQIELTLNDCKEYQLELSL